MLNAGTLGPSPLPALADLRLGDLRTTLEANLVAQLGVVQALLPHLRPGATIVAITSDAAVEPYEGWGAYAAAKAGFEQLAAVLGVERPDLRVLRVDPGDMRTQMHQDAFPGEDISDRPLPEDRVPGLRGADRGTVALRPLPGHRRARPAGGGVMTAVGLPDRVLDIEVPDGPHRRPPRRGAKDAGATRSACSWPSGPPAR